MMRLGLQDLVRAAREAHAHVGGPSFGAAVRACVWTCRNDRELLPELQKELAAVREELLAALAAGNEAKRAGYHEADRLTAELLAAREDADAWRAKAGELSREADEARDYLEESLTARFTGSLLVVVRKAVKKSNDELTRLLRDATATRGILAAAIGVETINGALAVAAQRVVTQLKARPS